MVLKSYSSALSILKDLGMLDTLIDELVQKSLRSDLSLFLQRKYRISEEELKNLLIKNARMTLMLIFLPHAKITIPCAISYELLKYYMRSRNIKSEITKK